MSISSHTIMKMRCELQAGMPALPGHFGADDYIAAMIGFAPAKDLYKWMLLILNLMSYTSRPASYALHISSF